MTMYMTPYRRRHVHNMAQNDHIARNFGLANSDVHIPLDVKDEKDAFVLYAIVPGLNAEDIEIEVLNDTVSISGEFKHEEDEADTYLRRERPSGSFHRSLRFASKLDSGKAEANLENGILSLRIPKVPEAQPKSIKVKTK
ncbi:Hsp20/alpha crystallin family protein [Chloroflexota bacterium]